MKNKPKSIFITGGAGFIGVNLVHYLLEKGNCKITVYDNLSNGSLANLNKVVAKDKGKGLVKFVKGDIVDFGRLNKSMRGHDIVVHLAAQTSVIDSIKNPEKDFMINSVGTFNTLDAARLSGADRFVYASSNAVIGEQKPPINERMLPKPISPYGENKLCGEKLCFAYYNSCGLKTVSLRFANVYGEFADHKESVVAKFFRRARKGLSLEIYGDGSQTRDFVHAQDICQAIYLCISAPSSKNGVWGEVFQVGKGTETRIIDLARMIQRLTSLHKAKPVKIIFKSKRKGEIIRNFSQISKARRVLGYSPRMNLESSLRQIYA